MDLFSLAVALTRAEAEPTLAKLAQKHSAIRRIARRRPQYDFETVVYVDDDKGATWEIRVGVSYDATYDPGVYTGPWEDSYPASGDMDLTEVVSLDDLPAGMTEEMVEQAAAADERITDEAWEDYHSKRQREDR